MPKIRKQMKFSILLPLFLSLFMMTWGETVSAQEHGKGISDVTLMELETISDLIMSPGCAYKYTLTSCPSVQAVEMRELIKGKLVKGDTREEILQYFLDNYGERVLAAPQKKGFFLLAWWAPYVVIADAAIIIAVVVLFWRRRSGRMAKASPMTSGQGDAHEKEIDREIEDELKRMDT